MNKDEIQQEFDARRYDKNLGIVQGFLNRDLNNMTKEESDKRLSRSNGAVAR